jgi:hypothetical protein
MAAAASMTSFIKRGSARLMNQVRAEILQELGIVELCFDLHGSGAGRLRLLAFRGLGARTEHSGNPAAFIAPENGEGEPCLLVVAFPVHHQRQVFVIIGLPSRRHR